MPSFYPVYFWEHIKGRTVIFWRDPGTSSSQLSSWLESMLSSGKGGKDRERLFRFLKVSELEFEGSIFHNLHGPPKPRGFDGKWPWFLGGPNLYNFPWLLWGHGFEIRSSVQLLGFAIWDAHQTGFQIEHVHLMVQATWNLWVEKLPIN